VSEKPAVCNASPIIGLAQIGHLDLLRLLFEHIYIPSAVAREIEPSVPAADWIVERALTQPLAAQILGASLDAGESEAISLAVELSAGTVVLDDWPARQLAIALGLPVVGTLGVLVRAKSRGLLPTVRPHLEALTSHGFWAGPELMQRILRSVGEV
jgi:predicted nucleic acid-binding protein